MTTSKYLESKYPTLTRFVNEIGRVEIGLGNYMISAFVIAYDDGGTIYGLYSCWIRLFYSS